MAYKCVFCEKFIIKDEPWVPYKKRRAHETCFNIAVKAVHKKKNEQLEESADKKKNKSSKKPTSELKNAVSEEEYKAKQEYYTLLRTQLGIELNENLPAKCYALSDTYVKKYDFTWEGLKNTLDFLINSNKELTSDIIGLIPYYYSEAQSYYESLKKIEENNRGVNYKNMYKEKVIYIQPGRKRSPVLLDIKSIGKE